MILGLGIRPRLSMNLRISISMSSESVLQRQGTIALISVIRNSMVIGLEIRPRLSMNLRISISMTIRKRSPNTSISTKRTLSIVGRTYFSGHDTFPITYEAQGFFLFFFGGVIFTCFPNHFVTFCNCRIERGRFEYRAVR